jgi:hypothetical protein
LRQDPGNFGNDLSFAFGGQSSFTIFPSLIAGFLGYFSASTTSGNDRAVAVSFSCCQPGGDACPLSPESVFLGPARLVGPAFGLWCELHLFIRRIILTGRSLAEPLVLLALAVLAAPLQDGTAVVAGRTDSSLAGDSRS